MRFLFPIGFAAILSVAAIILMYMLKQKQTEQPFSSIMLWEKAVLRTLAQKPWQKLRTNLLMFLQILAAVLLVFALAGPRISGSKQAESFIIVLDASYTMQSLDGAISHFDRAKQDIAKFINNADEGSVFSLVVSAEEPSLAVNFTEDKRIISAKLDEISVSNGTTDDSALKSIVNALYEQQESEVCVFSAKGFGVENVSATDYRIGESANNLAVTSMSHSIDSDKIVVMVKIHNYSQKVAANTLALYADDVLHDIKDFSIEPDSDYNMFFTNVPLGSLQLMVKLTQGDSLEIDNSYYHIVEYEKVQRTIYFSKANIFLENALGLMSSIELYKGDIANINDVSGYYLYVYDGVMPDVLPQDGHIIIFNPDENNELVKSNNEVEVDSIIVNDRSFLNYIEDFDFSIYTSKTFSVTTGDDVILSSNGEPIAYANEQNGRRVAIFGFDLHATDLPLRKEFPVFMYNLIQWFVPGRAFEGDAPRVYDKVNLNVYPDASSVKIVTPENKTITIGPPFPVESFNDTNTPGFYVVEQVVAQNVVYGDFAVNLFIDESSDLNGEYAYSSDDELGEINATRSIDLRNVLLILCLLVLVIEWYVLSKGKLKIPDVVRCIVAVILILSLFDINIKHSADKTTTIFAVDLSASAKVNKNTVMELIEEALKTKPQNDSAGLVVFGKNAVIESMPNTEMSMVALDTKIQDKYTNIAGALLSSQSVIPENSKKKIILISDGNENVGSAFNTAKALKEQGVSVDVYRIKADEFADAQISKINVAKNIGKDMNYNIEVVTYSLGENTAKLNIYKNDIIIATTDVIMKDGENRFVFTDTADIGGNIIYRAEITPAHDYIYENNKAYAYSYVEDVPQVLVIDHNGSGNEIEKILAATSIQVDTVAPLALPVQNEQLNLYDAVVMPNISFDDMPEGFPEALELYVKNGGGLVTSGGDNSFALGGYYKTLIETILPVDMELKNEEELPDQSMVIVMDRSGSMSSGRYGLTKLELAKESVIRSVDALNDNDYFGVLVFDTQSSWAVELSKVEGNSETIIDKVASISEGGGTLIKPAVERGFEALKASNTKLKHIILLTDGQDSDTGYDSLIEQMQQAGVTMSTVAIGNDSDVNLLESLAEKAGGRFYYTDEFTDLPKIFTKETFLAGKKYLNNEPFYPGIGVSSTIMDGIEAMPPLNGYISSTSKPRADVILTAGKQAEPLLASWQYGIGRSVAFLSDLEGNWSGEFLAADEGVMLFRNMLSWCMRKNVGTDIVTEANATGEETEIVLTIPYSQGVQGVNATIITPDMEQIAVRFIQSAPGEYKAKMAQTTEGAYIANIELEKEGFTENVTAGINVAYSKEYDLRQMQFGNELLLKIANAANGTVLEKPADFFRPFDQNVYESSNIKPWLILFAILLLLFDIAYHRFAFIKAYFVNLKSLKLIKKKSDKDDLNIDRGNVQNKVIIPKVTNRQLEAEPIELPEMKESKSTSSKLISSKKKRTGR